MIEGSIRYISGKNGKIDEVILPIALFKRMVEDLEDKELLRMMKQVEKKSGDYFSEYESFQLIDSLIQSNEIQTQ